MRSSHLQARLDLGIRIRGAKKERPLATSRGRRDLADGRLDRAETVLPRLVDNLPTMSLAPVSATWKRNPPGSADELDVTVRHEEIPFALTVFEGAAVDFWLFEHRDPRQCTQGEPGHFSGIVDEIQRDVIGDGTVTLTCRDWTALALGTKLGEDIVKSFKIENLDLLGAVERLLRYMPGGETWTVESIGRAGATPVGVEAPKIEASKSAKKKPKRAAPVKEAPNLAMWVQPGEVSVWDAISDLCVRHGVVPEVGEGTNGRRVVTLIPAADLQTSTALRPFNRADQGIRRFVEGADVTVLTEALTLSRSEKLPDFVVVASIDARTGIQVSARWPPEPADEEDKKRRTNGIFQTVDGVQSQAEILQRARDMWQGLAHNQYRVQLGTPHPWSAGGGPYSPDLLDLAYGAGVMLERRATPNLGDGMVKRGVDVRLAMQLAEAHRRMATANTLFQVTDVQHQWGPAEYSCSIGLRQFIGFEGFEVIEAVDPRGFA